MGGINSKGKDFDPGPLIPTVRVDAATGKTVPSSIHRNRAYVCAINEVNPKAEPKNDFKEDLLKQLEKEVKENLLKNLEKDFKKEIFKYIDDKLDLLEQRMQMSFMLMKNQLLNDSSKEEVDDEETESFRTEDSEYDYNEKTIKDVEHHYIGDDFDMDKFVDDIFSDEDDRSKGCSLCEVQSSHKLEVITESMPLKEYFQKAHILL